MTNSWSECVAKVTASVVSARGSTFGLLQNSCCLYGPHDQTANHAASARLFCCGLPIMRIFKRLLHLVGALPLVISLAALGQTIAAPPASSQENPPPGGCMPIGVTAAGDLVFPLLCRDFIERHRASGEKPTEVEKPSAVEKPISTVIAVDEGKAPTAADDGKSPGMPSYALLPEQPAIGPGEPIPSPRPRPKRLRAPHGV
jgi:hypothetical protein